jgi:NodT family efflux transporter outer membrane factor (OMF) lipoprotein
VSATIGTPLECTQWWNSFHDPQLVSLVERAIAANLDLRQATARIRQARAARGVGAAAFWPSVDSFAAYTRTGAGGTAGGAGDSGSSGGSIGRGSRETDLFQAGLDAAWELDFFGGTRRTVEALDADLDAAVEDRRDVLITLTSEVALNYLTLRGLQTQIGIARDNLEAQEKTVEITRTRFEAGFVSGLDVANARAQAATTASQIPTLESDARATIHALSLLLGLEPNALLDELQGETPIEPVPPEVPIGLPSDLIRRRSDIRRVEAQIHAATARVGVATADLFPRFSLTGSLSFSGDTLSSMASWSSRVWSVGPSMQWLIFDAGRIRWNIELQKAIQEQTLLAYQQTVLTALKEVESSLVAYAKEQEHRQLLEEAVSQNRKAVALAKELYSAGQTDFLNVLSAQGALFLSEEALARSTRTLSLNLVALYKALGGGWEGAMLLNYAHLPRRVGCHGLSGACPCELIRSRASFAWPVPPRNSTALMGGVERRRRDWEMGRGGDEEGERPTGDEGFIPGAWSPVRKIALWGRPAVGWLLPPLPGCCPAASAR